MRLSRLPISKLLVFVSCAGLLASEDAPEPPQTPKISNFAPADDLLRQVDFYLGRADQSLADASSFDLASQSRTLKDANTLSALAMVLSMHDQEFPQKQNMPTLMRAAQRLAAGAENYEQAVKALSEIKAARQGSVEPGESSKWEKAASLSALMKQVPLIHAGLIRGVSRRRLARQAERSSAQSAALAAIAQASMFDTEVAATADEIEAWRQYCAEMRDSAGEVNAAIHAQDAERVDAGMKRLLQSCETCHATFRPQIQ